MRPLAAAVSAAVTSLVVTMFFTGEAESSAPPGGAGSDRLEVYLVEVGPSDVERLAAAGVDTTHLPDLTEGGRVEIVATSRQARALRHEGLSVQVKRIDGVTASTVAAQRLAAGQAVYRSYSEPGGIADELRETAARTPSITKLVTIGTDRPGPGRSSRSRSPRTPRTVKDGKRPAVLYVRRPARPRVDHAGDDPPAACTTSSTTTAPTRRSPSSSTPPSCGSSRSPTRTATTSPSPRATGCGARTCATTTATARSPSATASTSTATSPTKWGYDNEGSSPDPASETYRGTGPNSEPETQALDGLFGRVGFEFFINYHSAAELLLYGIGWQVSTPSPDDVIYEAMVGDDANPAVPGYDPDISAELYTTNGDTDTHATGRLRHARLHPGDDAPARRVSDSIPDDEWLRRGLRQRLHLPRRRGADPGRVREEHPVRAVGRPSRRTTRTTRSRSSAATAPDLVADPFDVSYGTHPAGRGHRQAGAARTSGCSYSVNGGPTTDRSGVTEWQGGERYGDTHDDYYAEFRGTVTGTKAGDQVEVWFTGRKPRRRAGVSSEPFTYTVARRHRRRRAHPRRRGRHRHQPGAGRAPARSTPTSTPPRSTAAGYTSDVYDFDAQGRTGAAPPRCAVALRRRRVGDRRRHHPARAGPGGRHGRQGRARHSSCRCATTSTRAASCW